MFVLKNNLLERLKGIFQKSAELRRGKNKLFEDQWQQCNYKAGDEDIPPYIKNTESLSLGTKKNKTGIDELTTELFKAGEQKLTTEFQELVAWI